jgi:hypothetical protein
VADLNLGTFPILPAVSYSPHSPVSSIPARYFKFGYNRSIPQTKYYWSEVYDLLTAIVSVLFFVRSQQRLSVRLAVHEERDTVDHKHLNRQFIF